MITAQPLSLLSAQKYSMQTEIACRSVIIVLIFISEYHTPSQLFLGFNPSLADILSVLESNQYQSVVFRSRRLDFCWTSQLLLH